MPLLRWHEETLGLKVDIREIHAVRECTNRDVLDKRQFHETDGLKGLAFGERAAPDDAMRRECVSDDAKSRQICKVDDHEIHTAREGACPDALEKRPSSRDEWIEGTRVR